MTSKEALEIVKDYLLPKLKEDNSELGSIIIVESVNVLEKLVEQAQKQEKLLKLYKELTIVKDELISIAYFGDDYYVNRETEKNLEKEIKEKENAKI